MDATEAARREAQRIHQAAVAAGDDPWNLLELVQKEATRRGIDVYALPKNDSALKGGQAVFDSQTGSIMYEEVGSSFDRAFLIAHELGHLILEGGEHDVITTHVEPDRSSENAPVGIERVLDYGPHERREVRMDLFAREFLLPRPMMLRLHVDEGCTSTDIAKRINAPVQVVQQQLLDALLLPTEAPSTIPLNGEKEQLAPDPTQISAATHRHSAFQLQAGPGTGKTRTLVQRIERLLAEGIDPTSILTLTFSNKAANELNERLAAHHPKAAAAMWIGTFHAFGLDIIRRFHDKLGLPPNPRLLDRSDAIELLEDEFPRLPLSHYRNLWDPALDLSDILSAISRAKDEVVDAARYRALAQAMLAHSLEDSESRVRAEKCLEVALVYETYERLMTAKQLIDFGDLVASPVRLVETDSEVRNALRTRHKHVLVDEYQDVNRASVRLLKAIVGDGRYLWVVGDARQSIYRFRGASSTNMVTFTSDFPGAMVNQLGINYRSGQEVIDAFTTFSTTMKASAGSLPLGLQAHRGALGSTPEFRVVGSADDEISAVAAAIQTEHEKGTPYRQQAILCASNARLSAIAEGLEARDIPVLHLGSLFERPEIKDLLALLSLLNDPHAVGLIRVATMPAYSMPLQDVALILAHLRSIEASVLDWRHEAHWPANLPNASKHTLARIADLFKDIRPVDHPWSLFSVWIIDRLGLARTLYLGKTARSRMKGLALWQFLNFCRRQPSVTGLPCTRLLDRVRRLVLLSEDRGLRYLPASAQSIDAVPLMTIHASKGLEFHTVHIPGLVTSGLPRNNRTPRCLPPDGLIHGSESLTGLDAIKLGHDEEEECLFFVALSRARDRLFLYASSELSDGKKRNPSKFISIIRNSILQPLHPAQLKAKKPPLTATQFIWEQPPIWTDHQINLFERCPRRFLYSHVLRLGGRRTETAFMKMHNVVSEVFNWIKTTHQTTAPTTAELATRFDLAWDAKGATNHGYADDYRNIALHLVNQLMEARGPGVTSPTAPILLTRIGGNIAVTPDFITCGNGGQTVLRRIKIGKLRSNAFDDIEYTLLLLAAHQAYGESTQVEVTYLTSEITTPLSITARKLQTRTDKLQDFTERIHSGNFPAKEDARTCPRCPHFFICGIVPVGTVMINKS